MDTGPMVHHGPPPQHKLARTSGHPPSPPSVPRPGKGSPCTGPHGQRGSQGSCEPTGRHQIPSLIDRSAPTGNVGGTQPSLHQGRPHFRGVKHTGRLPEQDNGGPLGVASTSEGFQGDRSPIRPPSSRSLCVPEQHSAAAVLLPVLDSHGRGDGRAPEPLAPGSTLCLPAPIPHSSSDSQAPPGAGRGNSGGSPLAKETLVRRSDEPNSNSSLANPSREDIPQPGGHTSPGAPMAPASRLALERYILSGERCSPGVIRVIQASRRPSTNRIYEATWRGFQSWCRGKHITASDLTVPHILDYLLEGLERGLAPSTLRRHVAALATVLTCGAAGSLGHHPLIRSFLKGAVNSRPPTIHRYPSWELPRVLRALTRAPFEPLGTCDVRYLSHKVAFLVAITSARRISELAALSTREDLCVFHQDRVVLRLDPTFIPKVNSLFHRTQEIVLPDFCPNPSHELERQWHRLDVRRALQHYLARTADSRRSEALFVSFHPSSKGQRVSPSTIGRWIRACIAGAYQAESLPAPARVTAHSTRSAATSAAWATQASIEDVCRAATWTSPSPFIRHYRIDRFASAEASFGRRVLQQALHQSATPDHSRTHPQGQ